MAIVLACLCVASLTVTCATTTEQTGNLLILLMLAVHKL